MKKYPLPILMIVCLSLGLLPAHAVDPEVQTVRAQLQSVQHIVAEDKSVEFLDGQDGRRFPLTYNGTIYIPLRTAGMWMGARVSWDQENMTVDLASHQEPVIYLTGSDMNAMQIEDTAHTQMERISGWVDDAQLRPDISVALDGVVQQFTNVLGEPVYPLLSRECVYLPVRNIGALCGKDVLWFSYEGLPGESDWNTVYLYAPPTQDQLAYAQEYFSAIQRYIDQVKERASILAEAEDLTRETLQAQVQEMRDIMMQVYTSPLPSFAPALWHTEFVKDYLPLAIGQTFDPYLNPEAMLQPWYAELPWQEHRDDIVDSIMGSTSHSYFRTLEHDGVNRALAFLSAVAANG